MSEVSRATMPADDADVDTGQVYNGYETLTVGVANGYNSTGMLRFPALGIPAGSTIETATLNLRTNGSQFLTVDVLLDTHPAPISAADETAPRTAAAVQFAAVPPLPTDRYAADVTGLLSAMVAEPDWDSAGGAKFALSSWTPTINTQVWAAEAGPAWAPSLDVTFTPPFSPLTVLGEDGVTRVPATIAGTYENGVVVPPGLVGVWDATTETITDFDGGVWEYGAGSAAAPAGAGIVQVARPHPSLNVTTQMTGVTYPITASAPVYLLTAALGVPAGATIVSATFTLVAAGTVPGTMSFALLNEANPGAIFTSDRDVPAVGAAVAAPGSPVDGAPLTADLTAQLAALAAAPGWSGASAVKIRHLWDGSSGVSAHNYPATNAALRPRFDVVYEVPGEPGWQEVAP